MSSVNQINKYGKSSVNTNAQVWNKLISMPKEALNEKIDFADQISELIVDLFDIDKVLYQVLQPEQWEIQMKEINTKKQYISALILMSISPEHQTRCLDFLGSKTIIDSEDVACIIRRSLSKKDDYIIESSQTAMFGNKMSHQKQTKKKGCVFCNKNHFLSECESLRKLNPDAEIFKRFPPKNVSKGKSHD